MEIIRNRPSAALSLAPNSHEALNISVSWPDVSNFDSQQLKTRLSQSNPTSIRSGGQGVASKL